MEQGLFAQALAKLSREERKRAWSDAVCYGTVMIELKEDGTARLLNPMEIAVATVSEFPKEKI